MIKIEQKIKVLTKLTEEAKKQKHDLAMLEILSTRELVLQDLIKDLNCLINQKII